MTKPVLLVRADAGAQIGTGHVMRCLALAQAWRESADSPTARVIFLMATTTAAIDDRLHAAGMATARMAASLGSPEEIEETIRQARATGAEWVVLDGYHFSPAMQGALRAAGVRMLCIDDNGAAGDYQAEIVLNHNFHACAELYARRHTETRLLLGPQYALLRPEFAAAAAHPRSTPEVARKLLVTLGGSDPTNATRMVLAALPELPVDGLEVVVIVGGSNPRRQELQEMAAGIGPQIRVIYDASNMAELMGWADLAISAAGATTLELACLGLPMLLLIHAENQVALAERMQALDLARNLGWASDCSPTALRAALQSLICDQPQRAHFTAQLSQYVDAAGARRVAEMMRRNEPAAAAL